MSRRAPLLPGSIGTLPREKGLHLAGRLAGGRKFGLRVFPLGGGRVRLSLCVEGKKLDERAGLGLALADGVALYGLFERSVDGPRHFSWRPGTTRALDLRGMKVNRQVLYSLAVYEPFVVSTRGWSLFVEGTGPGVVDLGAEKKETLTFSFQGPSLEAVLHLPGDPLS